MTIKRMRVAFLLIGVMCAGFFCGMAVSSSCKTCVNFKLRICELEESIEELQTKLYPARSKYEHVLVGDDKRVELEESAEAGDIPSMRKLALHYVCKADRTEKDLERAFQLYEKLAKAGDSQGMMHVANFYGEGLIDGKRNVNKAYEWFAKATDMGEYRGAAHIAGLYKSGSLDSTLNKNIESVWIQRAEEIVNKSNDVNDFYGIGQLFLRGQFLKKNPEKGIYYFKKAANADHWGAMAALAKIYYEEGKFDEAREWLDKAFYIRGNRTLESFVWQCSPEEAAQRRSWYLGADHVD